MRRTAPTRLRVLACVLIAAAAGVVVPTASADCGQQVIDSYFSTGSIGYHAQDCYAAALAEVDADAKMYSGIMGAIHAAMARDAAADRAKANRKAKPAATQGEQQPTATSAQPAAQTKPAATATDPVAAVTATAGDAPAPRNASLAPDQAAQIAAAADAGPPLAVILLAGLGILLVVVGGAGLAVRRLERRG